MAAIQHSTIDSYLGTDSAHATLREEIRNGLTSYPKSLPPKLFYDRAGSALFDRITGLPEYYLTRAERRLIASAGAEIMDLAQPEEIVELGPGSTAKVKSLLETSNGRRRVSRYVPFDFDPGVVEQAVETMSDAFPDIRSDGVIGDMQQHLEQLPLVHGRRMIAFLGSTIGNLHAEQRLAFLAEVRRLLSPGDHLLLGVDLVKDTSIVEAAYNDSEGVTAAFNHNVLNVVNEAAGADFDPDAFDHRAFYDSDADRIEMHLVSREPQTVRLRDLALVIRFEHGETIWTESSYKFTRRSTEETLLGGGLKLLNWYPDPNPGFALALAGPKSRTASFQRD